MYCKRFAFSGCKHSVLLLITTSDGNLPEVTEHNDKDEDDAAHCHRDEQSHLVDAVVHVICGGVRDGVEKEKKKKKKKEEEAAFLVTLDIHADFIILFYSYTRARFCV